MPSAPLRILFVAFLCVAALIGLVVREGMARASGQEVMLAMAGVDPRSLLHGHYVIVQLQENIASEEPCPPTLLRDDAAEPAWVALAPRNAHFSVAGVAGARAEAEQLGPLAARGSAWCFKPEPFDGQPERAGFIQTQLGIERFHIDQAQAQRIERLLGEQTPDQAPRIFAIVSIGSSDGRARLKGLQIDGERLMLDWL